MTPGLLWLLAGLALCGAEMLLPGVFLLWIGLAACGTGLLASAVAMGFAGQVASFAVLVALLLAVPLLRRPPAGVVNQPDDGLLGRECRAIAFEGASGRVRLGDGPWSARIVGGAAPVAEQLLQVVGREGTVLLVTASGTKSHSPGLTES